MLDFSSSYFGQHQVEPMDHRTVVLYGKMVNGTYEATLPVAAATIELAQQPTMLTVSPAEKTVMYGTTVELNGMLAAKNGVGVAGQSVSLQQKVTGKWMDVSSGTATTGQNGAFTIKVSPTSNAQYRVVFAGTDSMAASTSGVIKMNVKAKLPMPAAAVSGHKVAVSGSMLPGHSATVKMYVERKVAGKYRGYKSYVVKTSSSGTYKKSVSLAKGTWRVRVRHSDAGHMSSYSAWRGFSVR